MAKRDDILNEEDIEIVRVETPEWKKSPFVFVRTFSAQEMADFFKLGDTYRKAGKDVIPSAHIAVRAICDEDGKPTFTDDDLDSFNKKSMKVINRIAKAWTILNGLAEAEVKEQEKNS